MTTLTRATLGKIAKRQTKEVTIGDEIARIQKPTPLEYSQYQTSLIGKDGNADIAKFSDAILLLVARMWIDGDGDRLFKDSETKELGSIDLEFYQSLSEACQSFSQGKEALKSLGESDQTTDSDLLVESA
jgi:intein/homing endonuclease